MANRNAMELVRGTSMMNKCLVSVWPELIGSNFR